VRRFSTPWLSPVRVLIVTALAQPAVATVIHDAAVRYGISAAIVGAVEAAIIAWGTKGSTTAPTAPDTPKATG